MQQRVAIARALAIEPEVLLMDEPFSHLDELTARAQRRELLRFRDKIEASVVFVTHNALEAVYLADRVYVLSPRPSRIVAEFPIEAPTHARARGSLAARPGARRAARARRGVDDRAHGRPEAAAVSHGGVALPRDAELRGGAPRARAAGAGRHGARSVAGTGARQRRRIPRSRTRGSAGSPFRFTTRSRK